jgi:hypothetical protein
VTRGYGSIWDVEEKECNYSLPMWLYIAPAIVVLVTAVGCFGLAFLGWGQ